MSRYLILVAAGAIWGCGGSLGGEEQTAGQHSAVGDSARADTLKQAEAIPVETALARRGPICAYLVFNSTIETEAAVEIYPRVGGLVRRVEAEEGDQVAAGQVLVRLEDDEVQIENRQSEIDLAHLEAGFQRTEEMFRRQMVSDQDYENRKYELEQARLRRERARLALEYTVIRAPFAGVITARQAQAGGRVAPGTELCELVKLDDLIARVFVPGQYLAQVEQGQLASIASDFLPGQQFAGWVKRVSPVVDPRSGTFKVTVGVEDRWERLRPGLFVRVQIITATHPDAVLVPKEAVVYDGGERFLFVVADSAATRIQLEAGFEDSRFVEVLSQVQPGQSVIVVGQNGLKDQARVRVVKTQEPAVQG